MIRPFHRIVVKYDLGVDLSWRESCIYSAFGVNGIFNVIYR